MTAEIVDALLWRARSALRVDGAPFFAGHGLADPLYRPPRLPYASVLGPLSYHLEPERDLPREATLTVRTPGYLAGVPLPPATVLPAPGLLALLVDGDVRVEAAVDHGPDTGQPLTDARGRAAAARIEAALAAAVAGGGASVAGGPLTDPARLAEVAATTVRWDEANRRLVVASPRFGPVTTTDGVEVVSRVELAAPSAHADGLGLGDGALTAPSRLVGHRVPSPVAMAFDVRVDLWAGSQRHLATLVEAWARVTPTRCQLLLRPALPAADVTDGATQVALQSGGEAPTRWTVLQLEPEGGFADRRSDRAVSLAGGAAPGATGLALPTGATATFAFLRPPPVPDPLAPRHPAPLGWALATRVATGPGAVAGEQAVVAELAHGATSVLRLEAVWVTVAPVNGGGPTLACELRATAQAGDGAALPTATLRLPAAAVEAGVEVHALVDAVGRHVAVHADGVGTVGEAAPDPHPPAGGPGMELRLGSAGSTRPLALGHVQVHTRPLGPLDHRHRRATASADRWQPGDPVTLVRTDDGFSPRGASFAAVVVAVDGATLHLDRPVVGTWPRHDTAVAARLVFSQQTAVRRRDDLASHLTRVSLEHTVSGFVEPQGSAVGARLVESLDLRLVDRLELAVDGGGSPARTRPAQGTPDVRPELVPARSLRSTTEDASGPAPDPIPPD